MQNESKHSLFSRSLPIVAAALGKACGVTIRLEGRAAKTDGKTICLPALDATSAEEERRVLGLLCHECGHVRFTDMMASRGATPFEHAIDNALEDARIERAMNGLYPGAESFFRAAHEGSVKKLAARRPRDGRSLVVLFLLAAAERELIGRDWLRPLDEKLTREMEKSFGSELTQRLRELAPTVRDAESTRDITAIRRRVLTLLNAAEGGREKGNPGKDSSSDAPGGNPRSPSLTDAQAEKVRELLSENDAPVKNPMSLTDDFENLRSSAAQAHAKALPLTADVRPMKGDANVGRTRLLKAKADSVALRRALTGLVEGKTKTASRLSDRGRRLETRHLARLAVGNPRVFSVKAERRGISAAVHVLLDMSGSMGGEGGDLALRTSLGLILGLQSLRGVNPALDIFPGNACGQRQYAVCPVLRHGERLEAIDEREIAGIESWGATPMKEALTAAGLALAACRESTKLVFLITDGVIREDECRPILEEFEKSAIRVVAIQIGNDERLSRLVKHSASIASIEELQPVLFNFARQLLL